MVSYMYRVIDTVLEQVCEYNMPKDLYKAVVSPFY